MREYSIVDLSKEFKDSNDLPLNIYRGLDPGAHDIDPTEYFL